MDILSALVGSLAVWLAHTTHSRVPLTKTRSTPIREGERDRAEEGNGWQLNNGQRVIPFLFPLCQYEYFCGRSQNCHIPAAVLQNAFRPTNQTVNHVQVSSILRVVQVI